MRSQASAREKRSGPYKRIDHGELRFLRHSPWFIIFGGLLMFGVTKLFCLPLYSAESVVESQSAKGLKFTQGRIDSRTLKNGLRVLLKADHKLPLVSLFLCVRTGSADEGKLQGSGIAHLTEHMVFKGTTTRVAGEVFKEIESYGGKINAITSYDYTGYKITVPSEFIFPAIELLADMVSNATFAAPELAKEKQVVAKELKLNYDDPQRYILRLLWQTAYSTHPYKYPIIGQEPLFERLGRKDVQEFYSHNYRPNNVILAITGDISEQATLNFVKDAFGKFSPGVVATTAGRTEPEQSELRQLSEKFTSALTYLALGFHSVAITDADLFALDVLAAILGGGEDSRLYKLICRKKRLAYNIEASNYTPRQPGLFIISALLEEKKFRRVRALILKQIRRIKQETVKRRELADAKNKIISNIVFAHQTLEARAQSLALDQAIAGDYRFTEKYIRQIMQVNSGDILRVANKYLRRNNLSIVSLRPGAQAKKTAPQESGRARSEIAVEHLQPETRDNISSEVKKYQMENGLTLLVKENKDLPLVAMKLVFLGGLRAEEEANNGISNLLARMLDKGTKFRNAQEITNFIESRGARISAFSGNNSFGLSLDLLAEDFEQMLPLLAELATHSVFPQKELNRQKEKALAELKAQEDDIFASGTKLLKKTLFQRHPYRFATIGNKRALRKLTRRDLIKFYRSFCVSKNAVLAIFGDIDVEQTVEAVNRHFAGLSAQRPAQIITPQEPELKGVKQSTQVLNKRQSLILLGFPGTTVFSQDRYVLEVINQILSQSSGRLFAQIREKIGLAYTLGAYPVFGLDPGYTVIYVSTTPENIEKVKGELLRLLRGFKQELLSDEQLLQAKRALLGQKLISRQTNSAQALESALDELYGLGFDNYLKYSEMINRVEAKDVKRCAEIYFDLDNYAMVVVGAEP